MDMFMDKLAQKLTAQEIIKANTAADVEELNKLKNQIAEYNECLGKLQKLIDDGFGKLSGIRAEEGKIVRLAEEGSEEIKALRKELESLREAAGQQQERLSRIEGAVAGKVNDLAGYTGEKLEALSGRTEAVAGFVEEKAEALWGRMEALDVSTREKIDQLCGQLEAQSSVGLSERLDILEENVHKECVKVYRNVQAVMVEESGKQGEALAETKAGMASLKGKLGAILGISVAAMILSLAGVLYQVLSGLHVLPF